MKAFILAAGLGTRLRPLTNTVPKALVLFNGKPLIYNVINRLVNSGFDEFVVNVHHFAGKLKNYLQNIDIQGVKIHISDETGKLLDTGGALKKAQNFFTSDFLVHNVDIFTDIDFSRMIAFHKKHQALATLAVSERQANRVLIFDRNNTLCEWKNKNTGEIKRAKTCIDGKELAFSGIYIVSPGIFKYFLQEDVFSVIDVFLEAAKNNEKILAFDHSGGYFFDLGTIESLKKAEKFLQGKDF